MDNLAIGGPELEQALAQLRRINGLLGAAWPTLEGVARFWVKAGRPRRLHVLDVGAGSGDNNHVLLRWADRAGIDLLLTLTDLNPETCAAASRYWCGEPRVATRQADLFALDRGCADIVTASMVLHHIPTAELPRALGSMAGAARLGVVVNDLHRHWLAWSFIKGATALLSRNRMIRSDAPLSVARGFTAADFQALRTAPGLEGLRYGWRPLFRFLAVLPGKGNESYA